MIAGLVAPAGGRQVILAVLAHTRRGWKVVDDINEEEVERIGFTPVEHQTR